MQQLSKQMRDRQLKVQDRVKKQVSSVRNLPRVRAAAQTRRAVRFPSSDGCEFADQRLSP